MQKLGLEKEKIDTLDYIKMSIFYISGSTTKLKFRKAVT